MKIILTAVEQPLCDAWKSFCGDLDFVEIHKGSIFDVRCDAVVSPANSFGFMDGGIDHLYSRHFGWHVQERLQKKIQTEHHGELLVGRAEIVETDDLNIPFLIASPTMRVPMKLKDTVHAYLAARAVLLLVRHGQFHAGRFAGHAISDAVKTVAFPGLGTGVGGVASNTCAHQVRAAIDEVLLQKNPYPRTWAEAQGRHQKLYTDRIRDLQRD